MSGVFFLLFYFTISDPDDRIILFALLKNKENHTKGLVFISMKKGKPSALLPIAVFLVFYLGLGIYSEYILKIPMGFYNIPIVVAFLAAILVACLQNRSVPFEEKLALMGQGIGDKNIITMLLIFLAAGTFVGVVGRSSAESVAYFMLSWIPAKYAVAVLFVVACFVSTAMGTSVGTITLLVPIASAVAETSGFSLALCVASVMGGSMFGDNLSMISDTTIAATRTQGCQLRDKFRVNFLIALPAAIITIIVLLVVGRPETVTEMGNLSFNVIKVIPYLAVLVLALIGMNVFLVLTIGIFAAGIIGLALGDLDIPLFAQSIWNGFTGMNEVFFLSLFCGGMSEMIAHNGGITWLIEKLGRMMKGNKSAQVGVAALVSLADCATANNTVAIIVSGPMAKNMSRIHKVDPRRTASLLDVFSCVLQGMIPWGAQLLTAASLTTIYGVTMNPIDILPYMWYCWILAAVGILSIFIPFADGICRKDPWNWEYDVAESGVAAKKASLELERQESAQTPI